MSEVKSTITNIVISISIGDALYVEIKNSDIKMSVEELLPEQILAQYIYLMSGQADILGDKGTRLGLSAENKARLKELTIKILKGLSPIDSTKIGTKTTTHARGGGVED